MATLTTSTPAAAVEEMWDAANVSFSLCPLLTRGAIEALSLCGTEAQKALYLPKMVAGTWTGTMNLTEPQAGSDLSAVRTRAVPEGDHYRITGQKIYITWGEHDLAENIVHLVLARLPDVPEGVKGISLFVVPKYIPNADGSPGERTFLIAILCAAVVVVAGCGGGSSASPTCSSPQRWESWRRNPSAGWRRSISRPVRTLPASRCGVSRHRSVGASTR